MITIFKNFITQDELVNCFDNLKNDKGWQFNGFSTKESSDYFTFWYNDLQLNEFYSIVLFNRILEKTKKNLILHRVYANGQTYGLPGSFHTDSSFDNSRTFLIYMNPMWNAVWGGHTVFHLENNIQQTNLPEPGMGVLFKGNIPHFGSEPTRHFRDLRITVAFKMEENESK